MSRHISDPRIVLIGVTVHAAEFLAIDSPRPVLLYELAKGWLMGTEPELGEMHSLQHPHRPMSWGRTESSDHG